MKEAQLQRDIFLALSELGARLFRNNVGKAWIGRTTIIRRDNQIVPLEPGDVVVHNARRFHAGLCEGSSDLIGWTPVEITPEMVGQKLAVFTAAEIKRPKGRVSTEQQNFTGAVEHAGGIAMIARSVEEAQSMLKDAIG